MPTCPNCRAEVAEGNKFCPQCGSQIDGLPSSDIIIVTTPTVPGYRVKSVAGIASGLTARTRGAGGKFVATVILSVILGTGLGFGLAYAVLQHTEPYVYSKPLLYPTVTIGPTDRVENWILNWTPKIDIRIIRIWVWMGNPSNTVWEGDTFVTIGKPSNPWNPDSYTDTIQLLVHYQFDSHAPSPIPHFVMFDLTPGFKVVSGQTINVYRLFVNTENFTVNAGDVQVIIYYENA